MFRNHLKYKIWKTIMVLSKILCFWKFNREIQKLFKKWKNPTVEETLKIIMISPTNYYQAMKKHTHKKFTSVIEIFQNKIIYGKFLL